MLPSLCRPVVVLIVWCFASPKFRCFVGFVVFCWFLFGFFFYYSLFTPPLQTIPVTSPVSEFIYALPLIVVHTIFRWCLVCVYSVRHFNELTYIFIIFEIKINSAFPESHFLLHKLTEFIKAKNSQFTLCATVTSICQISQCLFIPIIRQNKVDVMWDLVATSTE